VQDSNLRPPACKFSTLSNRTRYRISSNSTETQCSCGFHACSQSSTYTRATPQRPGRRGLRDKSRHKPNPEHFRGSQSMLPGFLRHFSRAPTTCNRGPSLACAGAGVCIVQVGVHGQQVTRGNLSRLFAPTAPFIFACRFCQFFAERSPSTLLFADFSKTFTGLPPITEAVGQDSVVGQCAERIRDRKEWLCDGCCTGL
jgi:hypothetical protein